MGADGMNDYKDLIGKLREIEKYGNGGDDRFIGALIDTKTAKDAADALEQLTSYTELCEKECEAAEKYIKKLEKDRDEWKTLGEFANKRAEDYREMRRQRDKAIKERDAAIAEIDGVCLNCAHSRRYNGEEMCEYIEECSFSEKDKNPSKWEWREVREVERETD